MAGVPVRAADHPARLDPALGRELVQRLRAARPDAVHTHLLHADLYGTLAARLAGVPYVISSRHNDDRFRRRAPVRWLLRWLWRRPDAGIAISDAIRRCSIEVEDASPEQVVTVHYGLDPATVGAPAGARAELCDAIGVGPDALLVGSACRLIEQKGLSDGLRAFAQVTRDVPEAHYVIAGDGPLREALIRGAGVRAAGASTSSAGATRAGRDHGAGPAALAVGRFWAVLRRWLSVRSSARGSARSPRSSSRERVARAPADPDAARALRRPRIRRADGARAGWAAASERTHRRRMADDRRLAGRGAADVGNAASASTMRRCRAASWR